VANRCTILQTRCVQHANRRQVACFQGRSYNANPDGITDQESVTLYCFAHLHRHFEKKRAIGSVKTIGWNNSRICRPDQTFVARLNRSEATFQSLVAEWQARLRVTHVISRVFAGSYNDLPLSSY
jgi:hypothetical protein